MHNSPLCSGRRRAWRRRVFGAAAVGRQGLLGRRTCTKMVPAHGNTRGGVSAGRAAATAAAAP